jgi:hypothetical protein
MLTSLKDLRSGARTLVKNPGFSLIAIPVIAREGGANPAIFSIVNVVLLFSRSRSSGRLLGTDGKYEKPGHGVKPGLPVQRMQRLQKQTAKTSPFPPRTGSDAAG